MRSVILSLTLLSTLAHAANNKPVVAIYALDISPALEKHYPSAQSFIPASYVKWLEQAGARVTYILPTWSDDMIARKFDTVDGVLFTGGGSNLTHGRYADVARSLVRMTYNYNSRNPGSRALWGTCLGLETLVANLANGGFDVLSLMTGSKNVSMQTSLTSDCSRRHKCSILGESTPPHILGAFTSETDPVAWHWHQYSLYVDDYEADAGLTQLLRVVATSEVPGDNRGAFVAVMEAHDVARNPVFATMFHPEKVAFEMGSQLSLSEINREAISIEANNYLAARFVSFMRRKNATTVPNVDRWIAERSTTYTSAVSLYQQIYFFEGSD